METETSRSKAPQIVLGAMLMLIGGVLLLDRLQILELDHPASRLWPLALIVWGAARMWQNWGTDSAGSGAWLVLAGVRMLAVKFRVLGLTFHNSWPLLMVAVGLAMVWRSLVRRPAHSRLETDVKAEGGRDGR